LITIPVVPLVASSALRFAATGLSDSLGGNIDDVQLNAVPEPATLTLLGFGLSHAIARRLRSTRRRA
jgi:hypothetical protein